MPVGRLKLYFDFIQFTARLKVYYAYNASELSLFCSIGIANKLTNLPQPALCFTLPPPTFGFAKAILRFLYAKQIIYTYLNAICYKKQAA